MSIRTEHQVIRAEDGTPLFAVVPWDEYLAAFSELPDEDVLVPFEVAEAHLDGKSLIRAWREHLGMEAVELASRLGVSLDALAEMEQPGQSHAPSRLRDVASALGVRWEALRE